MFGHVLRGWVYVSFDASSSHRDLMFGAQTPGPFRKLSNHHAYRTPFGCTGTRQWTPSWSCLCGLRAIQC
eukprot:7931547-Alexandrium_andersonii.AAC.1